jgi:hypothetical protein
VATNFYFNNFPSNQITSEQLLIEDLVIEAMQIHGMDLYYLPRSVSNNSEVDYLYGEDPSKQYLRAYPIEMYLENVTGMDGEGDFISKFGLEIRDEITLLVSRRRFAFSVSNKDADVTRPREGDLIYVPLVRNFFEITFVEHENDQAMFYTLGRGRGGNVYVYALKLKQYVFSNEVISTGVTEVDDQIRDNYSRTKIILNSGGTGEYTIDEIVYQGTDLANATAEAIVHSYSVNNTEKYINLIRVNGDFKTGNVIGQSSGAIWTANVSSMLDSDFATMNNAFEDIIDNKRIETESDTILDWTERNPFGEG